MPCLGIVKCLAVVQPAFVISMHTQLWKEISTCRLSAGQTVSRMKSVGWMLCVVTMLMNAGDRWARSHLCSNKSLLEGSCSPVPRSKMKLHFFMLCEHSRVYLFHFSCCRHSNLLFKQRNCSGVNNATVPNLPLFEDFRICLGYEGKGWVTSSHAASWSWASRICIYYTRSWNTCKKVNNIGAVGEGWQMPELRGVCTIPPCIS